MLDSRNNRRYLFYAIGEIALVVIGILIALQINNWNEARKDRANETLYLQALHFDVEDNLLQYNHYQNIISKKVNVLEQIIRGQYNEVKLDSVIGKFGGGVQHDIFFTRYNYDLPVRQNTFQELISSGDISIIRSKNVRQAIVEYYTYFDDRKDAISVEQNKWGDRISAMIPGEYYDTGIFTDTRGRINQEGQNILVQRLKENLDSIRPLINIELQYSSRAYASMNGLKKRARGLLEIIEGELASRD